MFIYCIIYFINSNSGHFAHMPLILIAYCLREDLFITKENTKLSSLLLQ